MCRDKCEGQCVSRDVRVSVWSWMWNWCVVLGIQKSSGSFLLEGGKNLELLICLHLPSSGMIGRRYSTLLLRFSSSVPSSKLHSALTSVCQLLDSWTSFKIYFIFSLGIAVPGQQADSRGETIPLAAWTLTTENFHFLCILSIVQTQGQAGQWAECGSLPCLDGNSLSVG